MKFRIEDIPPEGRAEEHFLEESQLAERLAAETVRSFRFSSPIGVHLKVTRSGRVFLVKSRIAARMEWICARCLDSFFMDLASEFTTTWKPRPENFSLPEEVELNREDLATEFYEGEEIDVTSFVQDQILLTLPQKAICREECRGLCPRCGKNLNREVCQCREEEIDPRLAPLKSFRVH